MNVVAMARHGLILWENEATGSRKLSKCLRRLKNLIYKLKITKRSSHFLEAARGPFCSLSGLAGCQKAKKELFDLQNNCLAPKIICGAKNAFLAQKKENGLQKR